MNCKMLAAKEKGKIDMEIPGYLLSLQRLWLKWPEMFEGIRQNIEKLIALYETERREKERLARELSESREAVETGKKKIAELERQVDNLKLTQAFTSPEGGNPAAKEKIEKMIRQLDRCIAQLER